MLRRIRVKGFKSLADVTVELPRLSVLFGPNSAGKSNFIDAIQTLSRIGTQRTFMDTLNAQVIRGHAFELFAFAKEGFTGPESKSEACFSIEADLAIASQGKGPDTFLRYGVEVALSYRSGAISNRHEHLCTLSKSGTPKGKPAIEVSNGEISIRRQSGSGRPRIEPVGQNFSVLSDARLAAPAFKYVERARNELWNWRAYYLDPFASMRSDKPPMDVVDIGEYGQFVMPFLYKLKGERTPHFDAVLRTLRAIIPDVGHADIVLDKRGLLRLYFIQNGSAVSSRVVSEGTLRILALCALCLNPWSGSLLAFEEPENGVHPRRIELIAKMLTSLAVEHGRQVIVTTHSPRFCNAVLKEARERSIADVGWFDVHREGAESQIKPLGVHSALLDDAEVTRALALPPEDHFFESLILGGYVE